MTWRRLFQPWRHLCKSSQHPPKSPTFLFSCLVEVFRFHFKMVFILFPRRRSNTKYNDLQNQFSDLMTKNSLVEKAKMKLQGEIDILNDEVEKVSRQFLQFSYGIKVLTHRKCFKNP